MLSFSDIFIYSLYFKLFQVNALTCLVNTRGAELNEEPCKTEENEWCKYEKIFYPEIVTEQVPGTGKEKSVRTDERHMGERKCMGKTDFLGREITEGCVKEFCITSSSSSPECQAIGKWGKIWGWYACYCKSDNCNYVCTASDDCIKNSYTPPNADYKYNFEVCKGECQPMPTTDSPTTVKSNATTAEEKNVDSEATENPDASTVAEKTEDSHATEAATEEGKGGDSKATETSEGGTREREESGCQRITNSFENFFLFWILASFVNRGVNN